MTKRMLGSLLLAFLATVSAQPTPPSMAQDIKGPRYGGTLISVLPDDPPTFAFGASFLTRMVGSQLVEGLLEHEADLTPRPALAESWTVSSDGLTWTFQIRKNVKFHDGRPLTADDVVFSVNEVWLKHLGIAKTRWTAVGLQVEKSDSHTVVLRLKKPWVYTTHYLASHDAPILPRHLYAGTSIPENPYNLKPVGTGPFKFVEYVKGGHIALERNQEYWGRDAQGNKLPYLDRLVFRIIPDATARLLAMSKREVDYQSYPGFPVESVQKLKELGFSIGSEPVSGLARIQRVFINLRKAPLSDVNVRKALYHAINRDEIVQKTTYGFGAVSVGPLHQQSPAYRDVINYAVPKYEYNPGKANDLLDKAGYKRGGDGTRFELNFAINRGLSIDASIAELMRDYFKAVGVRLAVQKVDEPTRLAMLAKREFELSMLGGIISGPSPDAVRLFWHSSLKDAGDGWLNPGGVDDRELDDLLDRAPVTRDKGSRDGLWKTLQARFAANVFEWHLFDVMIVSAWNPDFVGLPQKAWGHYDPLAHVWWKKGKVGR